ncbi:sulfatase-like hydrolase/transferase [uncultured Tateyamaria sp.]|uniref:sulfatase-like hydrolase/transferase n=1 Tax=uncultured Tateyamaria sp. TaxID=455651 RepID=UPI00262A30E6|nr:sulfatase-like hydrolase/transferase [uncultured Tateyamaria sp.]
MSQSKKNIVFFSFDDAFSFWRYRNIFGVELKTPNLDRICAESTAFHAAYCQSPLCGPSRSSFMSGKAPPETGIYDNKQKVYDTVPPQEMWQYKLKEDGYFCSSGGKVHHGFRPLPEHVQKILYSDERKGFRIDIKLRPEFAQSRNGGSGGGISTTDPKDDGYYYDAQSADSFIEFLNNYESDQPFYREVGFFSPHSPFITPVPYKQMYPFMQFEYPPEWQRGFERGPYADAVLGPTFKTHDRRHWRKSVRNYFAAFSHGDHHLGRVWDALKASKHAENTIFVILTDHGHHLGENGRFGKSTLWEQTSLVPLIVHDPTSPTARVVTDPVALLDAGPTVLDYAGLDPGESDIRKSLRPIVEGGAGDPDRAVPTFNPHGSAIRKGKYRYIRYNDDTTELYDLETDWWQQENLGTIHPAHAEMAQAHVECCRAHGLVLG